MLSKNNVNIQSNLEPVETIENKENQQIGAHLVSESASDMQVAESFSESVSPTSPEVQKKAKNGNLQDRFADDQQVEETKGEQLDPIGDVNDGPSSPQIKSMTQNMTG